MEAIPIVAIILVIVIVLIMRFNKATGVSYKSSLYQVLNRINNYKENTFFQYEIISSIFPGMWTLRTYTKFEGKVASVDELKESRVDEILCILLASERKYLKLPVANPSTVMNDLNYYIKDNQRAYKNRR